MQLIDTHAHLNDEKFANDLVEVLNRAKETYISAIINCGYDIKSSTRAVEMANDYHIIYATVGVHPHDAKSFENDTISQMKELIKKDKVLAVGEIGLDYHYDFSPRDMQKSAFETQMDLAVDLDLPVIIHSRESEEDTLDIVDNYRGKIKGVFHCFSGDVRFAEKVLELGYYIGVDGPVTYKNAEKLREVIDMCPIDRLLLETDCPYMAPMPYRGTRNEPSYLKLICDGCAKIKKISSEEIAEETTKNTLNLFKNITNIF
ncbi:MAG: TatD family hydrolase [Armatimonadota bacterium]